jgi:hypothetical protein
MHERFLFETNQNFKTAGIYIISNCNNNKIYIGSSYNMYKRIKEHYRFLIKDSHYNKEFQNDWNLNHSFIIKIYQTFIDSNKMCFEEQNLIHTSTNIYNKNISKNFPTPTEKQIQSIINKINKTSTCWIWTGKIDKYGYGQYTYQINGERHYIPAHKIVYIISTGKQIPFGLYLCHKCKNKNCVNPKHIKIGSAQINSSFNVSPRKLLVPEETISAILELIEKDIKLSDISKILNIEYKKLWSLINRCKSFPKNKYSPVD